MNTQLEPAPKRGMGLLWKGCLILIALGILLVVVGVGGSFWTVRQVYLSDKPTLIPEATAPAETNAATPGHDEASGTRARGNRYGINRRGH